METKNTLTEKEFKVLNAIADSEYISIEDYNDRSLLNQPTWTFVCEDSRIKGKALSGVISSLVKKGFVKVDQHAGDNGDEDTICFTEKGFEIFNKNIKAPTKDPITGFEHKQLIVEKGTYGSSEIPGVYLKDVNNKRARFISAEGDADSFADTLLKELKAYQESGFEIIFK